MKRRQSHWVAVSLLLATSMLRLHCTFCLSLPRGTRAPIARTTTRLSLSQTTCHAENHTTYPQETTQDWRNHPDLNPLLTFQTWKVPSKHVQSVLQSPLLVQPPSVETTKRIRLVRPYNDTHQLVLRRQLVQEDHVEESLPQELLVSLNVTNGPDYKVQLDPSYFSCSQILTTVLPPSALPPPTAFEQVGHVAHLNLKPQHFSYKHLIGEVLVDTLPGITTVVQKVGHVQGPHRVYEMELLAGDNTTNVTVVEHGISIEFDFAQVYWSSRLAGERHYMLQHEILEKQTIVDVFSGVGAMCLLAATKRNCNVYANDWNPRAIEALQAAAKKHGVTIHTSCLDAYEYLVDIGLSEEIMPDHVILNYPLEAPSFLNALRWWPSRRKTCPNFHVYTFARATPTQSAAQVAIDLVAHNLVPEGNEPTPDRQEYLNALGCQVKVREIRDVAPGKLVMCVSFKATAQLLRHVQGDFV